MHPGVIQRLRRAIVFSILMTIISGGWPGQTLIADAPKPLSRQFQIDNTSYESMLLESKAHISITATGVNQRGSVSNARLQILAMPDIVILSEEVSLENGETRHWEIPPEKLSYTLILKGKSANILFKIDQKP